MAFHVMIKPCGVRCNMDCAYCCSHPKAETSSDRHSISDSVLEAFVRQYIEAQPPGPVVFTWRGGEPTLMGLDFYRRVVELERRHCPPDKTIVNDLQTNGLLLDDEWCAFLKENDFLVEISIDGPRELHDACRRRSDGEATFDEVMRALSRLHKYDIRFGTLTALHRWNAKKPLDVYRFLRDDAGSTCMHFLPVVEPIERVAAQAFWPARELPRVGSEAALPGGGFVSEWSVEPDDFGNFLCTIFDCWSANDTDRVVVPIFDCAIRLWLGMPSTLCAFDTKCGRVLAMDSDGSVYLCDRLCNPFYRLGSVDENCLEDLVNSEEIQTFASMKYAVSSKCRFCPWVSACRGECPKNRFLLDERGRTGLNYLCGGLQLFFEHLKPRMTEIISLPGRVIN